MTNTTSTDKSRRWRWARRGLLIVAIVATVVAVFYTEENWRGKRAWENCRRELEAKGAVLDWAAYIPPAVPEASNVFRAPSMGEWFSRSKRALAGFYKPDERTKDLRKDLESGHCPDPRVATNRNRTDDVLIAEITVVGPTAQVDARQGEALVQFADPSAPEQVRRLLRERVGPMAGGVRGATDNYSARPPSQIKPLRLLLAAEAVPDKTQITAMLPTNTFAPNTVYLRVDGNPEIKANGTNSFLVWLRPPPCAAAEFIAGNQPAEKDFEIMRQALKRPYARMDGDYEQPLDEPIPDFVTVRIVAQTLAVRAQCYLLLNKPEEALRELQLLHDLRFVLEGRPVRRPITLVAAMIHVAIEGLYAGIIADGLRLHAWQEPQLQALQGQLEEVDLLRSFYTAMESQRASFCRTLETTKPKVIAELVSGREVSWWDKSRQPLYWAGWMPRGWIDQNAASLALQDEQFLSALDPVNKEVDTRRMESSFSRLKSSSPYDFLTAIAMPNYLKASQTTCKNQTMVNEALVACGLERYRLAHREYPESLAALVPQYLEKVPTDVIGGKPLKYRRDSEGRYLLYSVGWNESEKGDWVWEGAE